MLATPRKAADFHHGDEEGGQPPPAADADDGLKKNRMLLTAVDATPLQFLLLLLQ